MNPAPTPDSQENAARALEQWAELSGKQADGALGAWMAEALHDTKIKALLVVIFSHSPYLTRLLLLYPVVAQQLYTQGADAAHAELQKELASLDIHQSQADMMKQLRIAKGKLALLVALADIGGLWGLPQVTGALSDFAEHCLELVIVSLLAAAHKRGEIQHMDPKTSGLMVLGMGKLGARELNYSSDIDLIIFFEPGRLGYKGRQNEQHFMNKLAQDIVMMMQERTAAGYVFRTDLRLRPDPASMPPAIKVDAAYYYYESVGQNWERAAMIKARALAGDIEAGGKFLKNLAPFMWRRSLDFAAINDIHSIKRQMDNRLARDLRLKGHNIKLGIGGIREIEFYTQILQLIWGGREPTLRTRGTCETLVTLKEHGLIDDKIERNLLVAYEFLRKLEHRLQMVGDEQTHSLPVTDEGVAQMAFFMGFASPEEFSEELFKHLNAVHTIYAASFKGAEALGDEGNLVFTGVSHDPETLNTIAKMGYENPETVSEIVMGWHHGSRRSTRTKRARELLTELMPTLLKRLSETVNPDAAFLRFNEFLYNLPSGVQVFSLFNANPHLLGLIADILGSAPTLANYLSKSPGLLDAVLYADFYDTLPSPRQLAAQLKEVIGREEGMEERMDMLLRFRNEKQFQAGVQLLKRMINAQQAGRFLADLADLAISQTVALITEEFIKTYGHIPDSEFAIIGMGKLGSHEMTFSSDIDLVFIYDANFDTPSDGKKSFSPSVYYNRLAQRLVNAITSVTPQGRLYEVDTRLRPSGKQGLLAVSTKALDHYFNELAWTFEYMAFTRARVITPKGKLHEHLEAFIAAQLVKPRDMEKLRTDAYDMRERVDKEFGTGNPWDIKYARGGLMDLDFIAQYLILRHAPDTPSARPGSASSILQWLKQAGRIEAVFADELLAADFFMVQIFNMLRLCSDRTFDEATALPGLKKLLCETVTLPDFDTLKSRLIAVEQSVFAHYTAIFKNPSGGHS